MASTSKKYARRFPIVVRARELTEGERIYDWEGEPLPYYPGDMFDEDSRTVMSKQLFDQLYMEVTGGNSDNEDIPSPQSQDVRER